MMFRKGVGVVVVLVAAGLFAPAVHAENEPDTLQELVANLESKPEIQWASAKDPDTGNTTVTVTNPDGSITTRTFRPDGSLASRKRRPSGSLAKPTHSSTTSGAHAEPPGACHSIIGCMELVRQHMNDGDLPPATSATAPPDARPAPATDETIQPEVIDALLAAHPGTTRERWEVYERMWRKTFDNPGKRESLKDIINTTSDASASASHGEKLLADAIRNQSGPQGAAALEHLTAAVVQSQRSTEAAASQLPETPPDLRDSLTHARQKVDDAKDELRTLKGVLDLVNETTGEVSDQADRIVKVGKGFGWEDLEQEGAFLESVEKLGEAAGTVSTTARLTKAVIEQDVWEIAKTHAEAVMPEGPDMLLDAGIAACEQNMALGNSVTDALGCLEGDCDPDELDAKAQQAEQQVQNFGKEVFKELLPVDPETIQAVVDSPAAQWVKDKWEGAQYVWDNYSFDAWLHGEPIPTRAAPPAAIDLDRIIGEPWD
ncbi:MAG: hypothetical protein HY595_02205 [Candidatus Omnitrophica bacterium]|nr:hypothetical protein [Candidatus Omnitrophota bacterium]